MGLICNIRI